MRGVAAQPGGGIAGAGGTVSRTRWVIEVPVRGVFRKVRTSAVTVPLATACMVAAEALWFPASAWCSVSAVTASATALKEPARLASGAAACAQTDVSPGAGAGCCCHSWNTVTPSATSVPRTVPAAAGVAVLMSWSAAGSDGAMARNWAMSWPSPASVRARSNW